MFVFNIVKKFLDEYTISKIFLFDSGSKKWLPKLLEHVDPSQLPAQFGGTMTDPDGNPKCLTKLKYGGKIPEELYIQKNDSDKCKDDFTDTIIKKGGQIQLTFKCTDTTSILKYVIECVQRICLVLTNNFLNRWEFKTFNHDIRFGVKRKNDQTGDVTNEIELARVASHQLDEDGFITCLPDCTCKFNRTFQN